MSEKDENGAPEQVKIDYMFRFLSLIQSLPQEEKLELLPFDVPKAPSYSAVLPHKTKEYADVEGTPKKPGQLEYLERLCKAPDADKACSGKDFRKRKLAEITYFRLKGYAGTLKKFRRNEISFETVCRVYECDAQLRALLLEVLQKIEVSLRSQLSNFHAKRHRPYGYLDMKIYDYREPKAYNHSAFLKGIAEAVEKNRKNPFVQHYLERYDGIMPIWAVSELMSFGSLVHFYKSWTEKDRKDFLSKVMYQGRTKKLSRATQDERFLSWLDACRKLRNVCAHCGQLYGRNFPWTPKLPPEIPTPAGSSLPLWASVLAAEFLYPDPEDWKASVTPRLKEILNSVPKADRRVLRIGLGFPEDWETQLKTWWNM